MNFALCIETPDGCYFEGETDCLTVRLKDGTWQLLAHHGAVVSTIEPGECRLGDGTRFFTSGGVLHFADNECRILCSNAADPEHWDELLKEKVERAHQEAERRKQSFAEYRRGTLSLAKAFGKMQHPASGDDD